MRERDLNGATEGARAGRSGLDNTVDVETPEHVRFRFRVAGPSRRAVAYLIDLCIRGLLALGVLIVAGIGFDKMMGGVMLVVAFLLEWGYYVFCESLFGGVTIGKRALQLRVIKEGGYPITVVDSLLRNLLRAADFLPLGYAFGVVTMALDGRFRRMGDLVAGTMVVIEERARVAEPLRLTLPAEELDNLPRNPELLAEEWEAIELFLRRSGTLSVAREAELAHMIAPQLAERLGVRVGDGARLLALLYARAQGRGPRRAA